MINARERHKLEEKSIKCIFIGYCSQTKAYRVYNPATGKVIISRNTVFNEEDCWQWEDEGKAPVFQIKDGEEIHNRKTGSMTTSESNSAASPIGSNSVSRSSVGLNLSNNVAGSSNGEADNDDDDSETSPMKTRSLREIYESCTFALYEEDGSGAADAQRFRSLVGGLIYLTHKRPDIMFAVSLVSRFMHKPTKHHYGTAKRVLKYVAGTLDLGIWYCQTKSLKLEGYCDSDWAGSLVDRKSTTGFCFTLGSGVVTWRSKKQPTVVISSCEAEYVAGGAAACEAVWMRKLLLDLGMKQEGATEIYSDSSSAIAMTKNPVFHGRAKHIEIKHHFIRELVAKEEISLKFCNSDEQIADIFTKALPYSKFSYLRSKLGMGEFESRGVLGM
ncbi:hypothetical protein GH714_006469 [Hevea brasiliensis]|uniref:Retroviral polymerase SH3-like domain-containing protein n=1 Tax=Hevea brasiliensis TaxID=3981 RepID=A0A6A6M8S2_HEVBR|nr:hypothetical protein GH714_006469 [Hevea brasiliensis]